jgi:hypothetical protein
MPVICFLIHGIGTQSQAYSDVLQQGIHRELENLIRSHQSKDPSGKWKGVRPAALVDFQPLYWADVGTAEQNNLYRRVYSDLFGAKGPKKFWQTVTQYAPARKLSMTLIGDVFGYLGRFEEPIKRRVFAGIAAKILPPLKDGTAFSIILVGHSLGSVILHDLISSFSQFRYAAFDLIIDRISVFTMGSPLSLFLLVMETAKPDKFRRWINFLHPRDPIAFPMRDCFQQVEDIWLHELAFNPGTLHSVYWRDRTVHRRIAEEIVDHYDKNVSKALLPVVPGNPPPEIFQPFYGAAAQAGFSNYFARFQDIPFADLIPKATEIDVCNVYGGSWVQRSAPSFVEAFCNPNCLVRVCTLGLDSPALPAFSYQFSGMPEQDIKNRIASGANEMRKALAEARRRTGNNAGRLQIYHSLNTISHSFYRFDDVIYWAPRPIASDKLAATPVPSLVFRNTAKNDDLFSWLKRDFELVIRTPRDSVLYYDSATTPP